MPTERSKADALRLQIVDLVSKAVTGEHWAQVARLEQSLLEIEPKPEYADVRVEQRVGNPIPYERMKQIRGILLHFNWRTERVSVVQRLAEIDVHGDVDPAMQMGSFYDYRNEGWVTVKVVPR